MHLQTPTLLLAAIATLATALPQSNVARDDEPPTCGRYWYASSDPAELVPSFPVSSGGATCQRLRDAEPSKKALVDGNSKFIIRFDEPRCEWCKMYR
jgi:hypothetical protein